jgi:uncharacterized protein involved in exopolysaccharide biosynthesis
MENEDEINLRDYLKVIQKKKFLIAAVILISLIVSAYYSFFILQNEYQTDAILYVKPLPAELSNAERYSSPVVIVSIITSNEVLAKTVEQSNLSQVAPFKDSPVPEESAIKWLKENIKVNAKDKMIYLSLKGTLDPEILQSTLKTNIQIVLKDNKDRIIQDTQTDKVKLDTLLAALKEQEANASSDLDKTLAQNSSDRVVMLERFLGLNSRLIATDDKLNGIEINRKSLDIIASPDFNWIEIISPPYKSEDPVGPKRATIIAIAGVLGLFAGIFAAFFKNYMDEAA